MVLKTGSTSLSLSVLCSLLLCASCGSPCTPRENIYPCSCLNVQLSKKSTHTAVICHRLKDSAALDAIFPALRTMQLDQLHLVDSFWGASAEANSLPEDWLTLLKVREVEIVDTRLAPCFACRWKLACRNTLTTKFTVVNSTSGDSLCTLCDTGKGGHSKFPWTSCLSRLQHFRVSRGTLTSLGADVFPLEMRELTHLDVTRNRIAKVDPKALANLTKLVWLDLSHNVIELVDFIHHRMTSLQFLDLSWNKIKTLGPIFGRLPSLKTLKAQSNDLVVLKGGDWEGVTDSLRNVDLRDNPLHCDCGVRFVNATFHARSILLGSCSTPPEYKKTGLRMASYLLNKKCDEEGNIVTKTKRVTPKMAGWAQDVAGFVGDD